MNFGAENMLLHELEKKDIPTASGIYTVRFWKDGHFVPIGRAAGTDNGGIIYIGKSQNLQKRIWLFRRVVFDVSKIIKGHVAANRYVRIARINNTFPPQNLWIEWDLEADCKTAEADRLMAYLNKYAELPPLNYGAPYDSLADELGVPQSFPLP